LIYTDMSAYECKDRNKCIIVTPGDIFLSELVIYIHVTFRLFLIF